MNSNSLSLDTLNAQLDEAVFAEPVDAAYVADLMLLIGGDSNPTVTADQIKDAAHRVTQRLAA